MSSLVLEIVMHNLLEIHPRSDIRTRDQLFMRRHAATIRYVSLTCRQMYTPVCQVRVSELRVAQMLHLNAVRDQQLNIAYLRYESNYETCSLRADFDLVFDEYEAEVLAIMTNCGQMQRLCAPR